MAKKIILPPPPATGNVQLDNWLRYVYERVGEQGTLMKGIAIADLPTASDYESTESTTLYYVHDSGAGGSIVFSNGTNWIDINTGVTVV